MVWWSSITLLVKDPWHSRIVIFFLDVKKSLCKPNVEEEDCLAVAIHVRAGADFYWIGDRFGYHTVINQGEQYLRRAMDYMKKKFKNVVFYMVSDSIQETKDFNKTMVGLLYNMHTYQY